MNAYYIPGRGDNSGWGGLGYGGFQGAMSYQGLIAYFFDIIYPNHSIELNVCIYNQVAADIVYRGQIGPPIYNNTCRQYPAYNVSIQDNTIQNKQCEDCRSISVNDIYSVHYTACRKPWDCMLPYPKTSIDRTQTYRLKELTNMTTCGLLFHKYFQYRYELETLIMQATGNNQATNNRFNYDTKSSYHPEYYLGYCRSKGNYISMKHLIPKDFHFKTIYGF